MADSLFSYMTTSGTYSSADLVSNSGWVFGFLFVAAAALSSRPSSAGHQARKPQALQGSSWLWLALPYLPFVAAGAALSSDLLKPASTPLVDLLLGGALLVMVLTRQFLAMADNQRLLVALASAGEKLEHQALHDALTGLPNRTLFASRLDQALLQPATSVSVMFCDLDHFKAVNDELGHEAGDLLLKLVAERLLSCVRATDTVARLGGDEFAVLLQDAADPEAVAERVVASMNQQTLVLGRRVRTSISVGLAHRQGMTDPGTVVERRAEEARPSRRRNRSVSELDAVAVAAVAEREVRASALLREADTAMYEAKSAGKGCVAPAADLSFVP